MGNTVRAFSTLGAQEPKEELQEKQEHLGDTLEKMGEEERLGDFLAEMSNNDEIDAVGAVRDVREDI